MSEQDVNESTGSRTPSISAQDRQTIEDLQELVLRQEAQVRDLLARFDPRPVRTSDVGGFVTPAEGSVENEPTDVPAPRPTSLYSSSYGRFRPAASASSSSCRSGSDFIPCSSIPPGITYT